MCGHVPWPSVMWHSVFRTNMFIIQRKFTSGTSNNSTTYLTHKHILFGKFALQDQYNNMCIYYAFGNHISSSSSMTTCVFIVWQLYFLFMPITFEICTHVFIYTKYNGHEVLSDDTNGSWGRLYRSGLQGL